MTAQRLSRRRLETVSARVERRIRESLERGVADAALDAYQALDVEKARAEASAGGPGPACAAGCAACCHVHVEVTRPELIAIAALVHERGAPALDALRARLSRHAEAAQLSDEERWAARVPCALLDERGRCSIYERRPLRCRAFHSRSRELCQAALDGSADAAPELDPVVSRATDAVEAGYDRALAGTGLSEPGLRLESGLRALLGV